MKQNVKKLFLILGIGVLIMVLCFAWLLYHIISKMTGDMIFPGALLLVVWFPGFGIGVLEIMVYVMGWLTMKKDMKEVRKLGKSTWAFGLVTSVYLAGIGLVFAVSDLATFGYCLPTIVLSVINFIFLIIWLRYYNRMFEVK